MWWDIWKWTTRLPNEVNPRHQMWTNTLSRLKFRKDGIGAWLWQTWTLLSEKLLDAWQHRTTHVWRWFSSLRLIFCLIYHLERVQSNNCRCLLEQIWSMRGIHFAHASMSILSMSKTSFSWMWVRMITTGKRQILCMLWSQFLGLKPIIMIRINQVFCRVLQWISWMTITTHEWGKPYKLHEDAMCLTCDLRSVVSGIWKITVL